MNGHEQKPPASAGGSSTRVPYSDHEPEREWVHTTSGRVACESCGEWMYPRHRAAGGPFELPPVCGVCGAPGVVKVDGALGGER